MRKLLFSFTKPKNVRANTESNIDEYRENFPDICSLIRKNTKKCCSAETVKRKLPIVDWLPKYNKSYLFYDIVAGLSVALTVIPQGIAYGVVAGLPPQYGLYSSFMGCFVYTIFGSCKDVSIGPTAIMSLMIHPFVSKFNVDFAILGTFLAGCVIFVLGFLNLGFFIQFISTPTIIGFTTAATFIIGSGQVRSLLGIKSGSSNDFISAWKSVFVHFDEIRYTDTLLGLFSLTILMIMKKPKCISRWPVLSKYLSISRNAIVVIIGMIIAFSFYLNDKEPFRLTGKVAQGLPSFNIPPMSTEVDGKNFDFLEMVSELGLSLMTIPLVSILEIVAIAKAFSRGKVLDATQEMITLGLCNVASSFFHSIPITGSFTRTAVNHNSGVKTTLGGVVTGGIVLMALGFLTKTFYFIPKTTLAAVIIAAMISMIEIREILEVYKTKRIDIIPLMVTFFVSLLLGLEFGILIGVAVNVAILLFTISRPRVDFETENIDNINILIITPNQSLNFTSAEYFKSTIIKRVNNEFSSVSFVLINGELIDNNIDVTVIRNIVSLVEDLRVCEKEVYFWNWKREPFHSIMRFKRDIYSLFKNGDFNEIAQRLREKYNSELSIP